MANDEPEDPRRRATPQVGWTHRPKDLSSQAAVSRSAVTPMPAKLRAAQAMASAQKTTAQKTTERDLPASTTSRKDTRPSVREERGDRYSDLNGDRVDMVTPLASQVARSVASSLPSALNEPYELEGALGPHLAWLEDEGRAELMGHLKRGDHPRALAMLGSAVKRYPRIVSITRAIQLVERAAIARLTKRVGDFDSIAVVAGRPGPSHEAISLAALIDGVRAIDEIVRMSTLPRLRTLELLDDLIRRGAVEVRDPYVQSSGKVPSGAAPSARRATPLAHRSPISSNPNPEPRPASVPPQRLSGGVNPFGAMRSKRDVSPDAPLRSDTTHSSANLGRRAVAAAENAFPDLEEDVGARVTIPGPIPGEEHAWNQPTPSPSPALRVDAPPPRFDDDGPSIAVEAIGPSSSEPDGQRSVEESALEEGLPAVLAFGLLSLPVRSSAAPSSPRAGEVSPSRSPEPSSVVASSAVQSSGAAVTEPQPTLVTPREPVTSPEKDGKVKMQTLKSAPDPEVVRAAERSDRESRGGVEVRSARRRDFEGTMESPVQAPPPPNIPPLPLKSTPSQPPSARTRAAITSSDPPRHASDAPKSDAPPSQRDTRVPSEAPGAPAEARSISAGSASAGSAITPSAAANSPRVQTVERDATPRWVLPVMVLVGLAAIGSALAVYVSLRTATEPSPTRDPGAPHAAATTPASVVVVPRDSASSGATPTTPSTVPSTMHVRIDATPRAARVTLDKVLLTAHPIDELILRDGKEHEIRVELAGYETFKKTFIGDGEVTLTITLKQLPQNAASNPSQQPPEQPTTPTPNLPTSSTAPPQPVRSAAPEEVYPTP